MIARADAATLNRQPRQRREVYTWLAGAATGRSVKRLLNDLDIPEAELRETLRKLASAGLARRTSATWTAVPLDRPGPEVVQASDDLPAAPSHGRRAPTGPNG